MVLQARPRRPALPLPAQLRPRARGPHRARPPAEHHRAAPGQGPALPVAAQAPLRALLLRRRRGHVRRPGPGRLPRPQDRADPAPPGPQGHLRPGPLPGHQRPGRRHPLLRRPGRRRPPGHRPGAHRRRPGGAGRQPHEGHRLTHRRARTRPRRPRHRPGHRHRPRDPGQAHHQCCRRVDRGRPGPGHRRRRPEGPGLQGHPHRGPQGGHRRRDRGLPAHREVRPVHHPLARVLGHRHHRHPLGPGRLQARGHRRRRRLHPRARQLRAVAAHHPRGHHRRLRGPAPPAPAQAQAGCRGRLHEGLPRAHGHPDRPGADRHRRRQADHLPGHGLRRRRPRPGRGPVPRPPLRHAGAAPGGCGRLPRPGQAGRADRR